MVLTERINASQLLGAIQMLKVIAHPVRLAIVDLLAETEKMTVLDIQDALQIEQAIASQHLTLMIDKGVLLAEKVGRNKYVSLRFPNMKNIVDCLEHCCNTHQITL